MESLCKLTLPHARQHKTILRSASTKASERYKRLLLLWARFLLAPNPESERKRRHCVQATRAFHCYPGRLNRATHKTSSVSILGPEQDHQRHPTSSRTPSFTRRASTSILSKASHSSSSLKPPRASGKTGGGGHLLGVYPLDALVSSRVAACQSSLTWILPKPGTLNPNTLPRHRRSQRWRP